MDWYDFRDAVHSAKHLQSFTFSNVTLPPQFQIVLVQFFCNHPTLVDLDLEGNGLTARAGVDLYSLIKNTPCLESLVLHDNFLKYSGTVWVARALRGNVTVKHLDLSSNQISHLGIHALTEHLCFQSPSALVSLDLSLNHFGTSGVKLLGHWLVTNPHQLHSIRLMDCGLDGVAVGIMLTAIASTSLINVDLSCNTLDKTTAWCTERLLSNNRTVKCLLLDANPMVPGERGCFAMPRIYVELRRNKVMQILQLSDFSLGDSDSPLHKEPRCTIVPL